MGYLEHRKKMKKITILGATGMLGHAVTKVFLKNKDKYIITITARPSTVFANGTGKSEAGGVVLSKDFVSCFENLSDFENVIAYDALDLDLSKLWKEKTPPDYIINCIGAIKPTFKHDDPHMYKNIYINSVFPHYLSGYAKETGAKLIHITTDCVFDGAKGDSYTENDLHNTHDNYGSSKSLGEPTNCMVLRTSVIGEEKHNNHSLVEWVKSKKGQEVDGYTNHLWNGITSTQFGEICHTIIQEQLHEEDCYHVFSPDTVSKHELVSLINNKLDLGMKVNEVQTDLPINRALSTVKELNNKLNVPSLEEQLDQAFKK